MFGLMVNLVWVQASYEILLSNLKIGTYNANTAISLFNIVYVPFQINRCTPQFLEGKCGCDHVKLI